MNAEREQHPSPDDPIPAKPALGQPGVRPDWLVSAQDGVEEESTRRNVARPPVIKPGMPRRPAEPAKPPASPPSDDSPMRAAPPDATTAPPSRAPAAAAQSDAAEGEGKRKEDALWATTNMRVAKKGLQTIVPDPAPRLSEVEVEKALSLPLLERPLVKALMAVVGIAIVALIVLQFIPKGSAADGTRIAAITKSPKTFDGRLVTVSGRVGEIFQIGQSWAYYLHDGNATLLVFTRKGAPESLSKQTVTGTISTGVLEGVARPSLFERAS